jgi:hypothetical protein
MSNLRMIDLFYYTLELSNASDDVIAKDFEYLSSKQTTLFHDNYDYIACANTDKTNSTCSLYILTKNMIGNYQQLVKFFFEQEFDAVFIRFADSLGNIKNGELINVPITNSFIDGPEATWHGGNHPSVLEMVRDFLSPWVAGKLANEEVKKSEAKSDTPKSMTTKNYSKIQLQAIHSILLSVAKTLENTINLMPDEELIDKSVSDFNTLNKAKLNADNAIGIINSLGDFFEIGENPYDDVNSIAIASITNAWDDDALEELKGED